MNIEGLLSEVDNYRQLPLDPIMERARRELEAQDSFAKEKAGAGGEDNEVERASPVQEILFQPENPPSPNSFWATPEPPPAAMSSPSLPRTIPPNISAYNYLNPQVPEKFVGDALADIAKGPDKAKEKLRKTVLLGSPTLKRGVHLKLEGRYGNYPLATRDRMDELREEQAQRARELYEKHGDRWPLDPIDGVRPPLGRARCKKLWRRAIIYAKAIAAMKAKPPKQLTRAELDKLLQVAIRATRKKIYYHWDCILGIFGIDPEFEKRRQRRLKMKRISNTGLPKEPKGNEVRASGLAGILRNKEIGPGCSEVEVLKVSEEQGEIVGWGEEWSKGTA